MVLGEIPVLRRTTVWMTVGQGPIVLAVGAAGRVVWTFLVSHLSPCLWDTARY